MDFHSLTRKELQALCKLNKIPANITNIAMADSLATLEHVQGLEQILNQSQPSEDTAVIGTPVAPRTSTRPRKLVTKEEPESSQPLTRTRRATRREVAVEKVVDQERSKVPPKTPVAPSTHGRAPLVSAAKNLEAREYSTRRSVRLLEQTLENLSLGENLKIQPMKIDELVNNSERPDVKEVSSEDESPEIQMELNTVVQEDLKSESELKDLADPSDEKMDVKNETLVEEVIAHRDVEISEEVIGTIEAISPEENSEGRFDVGVEPASEKESEIFVNLTSEEDSTVLANNDGGVNVAEPEASLLNAVVVEAEKLSDEDDSSEDEEYAESDVEADAVEAKVVIRNMDSSDEEATDDDGESMESNFEISLVEAEEEKKSPGSRYFAADRLSGQFPRPTSSSKSRAVIQMITDEMEEEEEEEKSEVNKSLEKKSLRMLQKMLKTKLQITNEKKAENPRIALQKLPENLLAVEELQKDN